MAEEIVETRFDTNLFEIAIYRNQDLDDNHGNDPEYTLVNHVSPALSEIGINHRIRWDFDPVPSRNNNNGCPGDGSNTAYDWWRDHISGGNVPFVAADSNLLLTNALAGGCGSVGGNVSVGPAQRIDGRYDRVLSGGAGWMWHVYSCMHEIGHNMGFHHSPNPAMKFVDDQGRLNMTPTNGDDYDTENMCGESVATRPDNGQPRVPHLYFHDCVASHITIRGPSPDPPAGDVEVTGVEVQSSPSVGVETVISVTGRAVNRSEATRTVPVTVNGREVGQVTFDLPATGPMSALPEETLDVSWVPQDSGSVTVSAGEASASVSVAGGGRGISTAGGIGVAVLAGGLLITAAKAAGGDR